MPIGIHIQPDEADLKKLQAAFDRLAKLGRNPRPVLGRIGMYVRRDAQRSLRSRRGEWGRGYGRLSKSLAMALDDTSVTVGSNLVYAAIQQLGGEVRPKSGKYLAIPATAGLRRSGTWPRDLPKDSMKYVPNAAIKIGSHSWIGPALVRAKSTAEERAKAGTQGRDKAGRFANKAEDVHLTIGEVMFALVRKVTIRAQPYLRFDAAAQAFALAEFAKAYEGRAK